MITRRAAARLAAGTAVTAALSIGSRPGWAADKVIKVGVDLSLTGADAEDATRVKDGIIMAFDGANQGNAVPGYTFELLTLDDGTATAGQYDPAQAATNARKMVSDKAVVAAIGPQMSGAGKAMTPILSQGNLATITPSSTNPDITNPKFAEQFRPAGKPIYFRTVTTDAFQGPNMANFMAEKLGVKSIYVLDDSGAYGVGLADAFQGQAEKKGIKVLGRDRLDPKAADYTAVLTKIKSINPQAAMAFSTLNGKVDVTFPAGLKAKVKLKAEQGDIFSDFDVAIEKGQTAAEKAGSDHMYKIAIEDWVYGSINGGGPEVMMKTTNGNVYVRKAK